MNTETRISKPLGGEDDFATLLEKSFLGRSPIIQEGEIVRGKVIQITHDSVIVDFGYKSEGQVPLSEFTDHTGEVQIHVEDEVDVYLENIECEDGLAVLSKEKADALKIWDRLQEIIDTDGVVEGIVVSKVKGGLSVDIGVKAFLPASQIDVRPPSNLDKLIGKKFRFKILKLNKRKGNIIISRRVLLEKDRNFARQEIMQNLAEGQTIQGTVKNITDYGAFIDLGGVDGLLHITDMTWGRIGHPNEIMQVGNEIKVKVLKIDPESGKVSLGLKQLASDPWEKVPEKYDTGTRVTGKVVSLADYGAFIELEQGIEGLVHISEMSWSRKAKHPSKIVNVGDKVECIILDMDLVARRISLGMKQINPNPWEIITQKYPIGSRITGPVRNVTDFGLFVGLTDDIDGLVHVSDVAWVRPARPLSAMFPKKADVEAVVLSIDPENERISLGVKQLTDDPWPRVEKQYGIGARHSGKIVWSNEKGIAVETEPGIEGFISKTELPEDISQSHAFAVGDPVDVIVHSVDDKERRINMGLVLESLSKDGKESKKAAK